MSNKADINGFSLVEPTPEPVTQTRADVLVGNNRAPLVGRRWSDGAGLYAPTDPNAPWSMTQQWPNLVAALSEQAVESSNLLLRALNYLVGAGRLRRSEAKALSDAMHQLRGTSLRAQQITRLASGRIRQSRERVDVSDIVKQVTQDRAEEFQAAGVVVSSELQPADVLLDPPVATSLVNALLDWATSFSKEIHFSVVPAEWPGPAQLRVLVTTPAPTANAHPGGVGWTVRPRGRRQNDGLHWMLLRQIAASSGLELARSRENGKALVTIDFLKTFLSTEGMACLELTDGNDASGGPSRDTWVLVLARDDRLRAEAHDALRRMGIETLAAGSTAEARGLVAQRRPNVLVRAYDIAADDLAAFRNEALDGVDGCPMVEITRERPSFHLSGFDRFETPKVGRDQITSELPATVLFELVKVA